MAITEISSAKALGSRRLSDVRQQARGCSDSYSNVHGLEAKARARLFPTRELHQARERCVAPLALAVLTIVAFGFPFAVLAGAIAHVDVAACAAGAHACG